VFINSLANVTVNHPVFPHKFTKGQRKGQTAWFKDEFKKSHNALNSVYFKCTLNHPELVPIQGLPATQTDCQCVVIFVEVTDKLKLDAWKDLDVEEGDQPMTSAKFLKRKCLFEPAVKVYEMTILKVQSAYLGYS
jgi:hypothetical protein